MVGLFTDAMTNGNVLLHHLRLDDGVVPGPLLGRHPGDESLKCLAYFWKSFNANTPPGDGGGTGGADHLPVVRNSGSVR